MGEWSTLLGHPLDDTISHSRFEKLRYYYHEDGDPPTFGWMGFCRDCGARYGGYQYATIDTEVSRDIANYQIAKTTCPC